MIREKLRKNFCPPRPIRLKKRTARKKRLKQKLTKSGSFCSTVILTSDKSDLEKDLCSASSVSFSSLDKQTDASSLGSSHKPHVCMMDAYSTENLPKHRVVTLCDPTGCSTDKMNGGVDHVDGGVDCIDGGADRIDRGLGRVDGVDCIDRSVSYIEGRTDTPVTSLIDATDSGKGYSQDKTENYLQCSFLASQELSLKRSVGTMTSSQDPMCITCLIRPINASFIHGKNTHTVCCYKCARIIERTTGRCPMCNRTLNYKVVKNSNLDNIFFG
uniref:RING-type domain-containing protein n=1 Tax=Timema shepardi TaxID=629360 RepID=A0A7R9AR15_TIMSH|nr:unnamed protein product [Timema shepardi]